jgi:hypothetical protein
VVSDDTEQVVGVGHGTQADYSGSSCGEKVNIAAVPASKSNVAVTFKADNEGGFEEHCQVDANAVITIPGAAVTDTRIVSFNGWNGIEHALTLR